MAELTRAMSTVSAHHPSLGPTELLSAIGTRIGIIGGGSAMVESGKAFSWETVGMTLWDPPLPPLLSYIPFCCRTIAIMIAVPFVFFLLLDLASYLIARTLHLYPKDIPSNRASIIQSYPANPSTENLELNPTHAAGHATTTDALAGGGDGLMMHLSQRREDRAKASAVGLLGLEVGREGSTARRRIVGDSQSEELGANRTSDQSGKTAFSSGITPSGRFMDHQDQRNPNSGADRLWNTTGPFSSETNQANVYTAPLLANPAFLSSTNTTSSSASASTSASISSSSSEEEDDAPITRPIRRMVLADDPRVDTVSLAPLGFPRGRNESLMFDRGSGLCDTEAGEAESESGSEAEGSTVQGQGDRDQDMASSRGDGSSERGTSDRSEEGAQDTRNGLGLVIPTHAGPSAALGDVGDEAMQGLDSPEGGRGRTSRPSDPAGTKTKSLGGRLVDKLERSLTPQQQRRAGKEVDRASPTDDHAIAEDHHHESLKLDSPAESRAVDQGSTGEPKDDLPEETDGQPPRPAAMELGPAL